MQVVGITLDGKTKRYHAHRLVFLYIDGYFPAADVDHIDGNGLNNARINLRKVSHQENMKNRPKTRPFHLRIMIHGIILIPRSF